MAVASVEPRANHMVGYVHIPNVVSHLSHGLHVPHANCN